MRHLNDRRQLGRNSSHRKAMFRNMATSMLIHGRIKTTQAKAKELRRVVEKLITVGKRYHTLGPADDDKQTAAKKLHLHRQAIAYLKDKKAIEVLLKELPVRFETRQGGYTRIIKLGPRIGDAAPMAFIELVGDEESAAGKEKKRRRRSGRKKTKDQADAATEQAAAETEETAGEPEAAEAPEETAPETADAQTPVAAEETADEPASENDAPADEAEKSDEGDAEPDKE